MIIFILKIIFLLLPKYNFLYNQMIKKLIIIFLLIINITGIYADDQNRIDSLNNVLYKTKDNDQKINLLMEIAEPKNKSFDGNCRVRK